MIATLKGEVVQVEETSLVVEIGGVGFRVLVPKPLRERVQVGEAVLLFTQLVVREDSLTLYGFENQAERGLFTLLLKVDGVGPRLAMSVLSTLSIDTVQKAVLTEQIDLLSQVPGVGRKTAQKIILYLHDRLKPADALAAMVSMSDVDSEVLAALTSLGYSIVEAQSAIQAIPKDAPDEVEERLRLALQQFTSGKQA